MKTPSKTMHPSSKPQPPKKRHSAFTLVELIVVITILAILGTIGFMSIGGYSSRARDSARVSDVAQLSKSLDLSIIQAGSYPMPDNYFTVTYSGGAVWYQGTAGKNVIQSLRSSISGGGLDSKPTDPLANTDYTYSTLAFGKAYQIKANYENDLVAMARFVETAYAAPGSPTIAYVRGNYGGLAARTQTGSMTYVLAVPSIVTGSGIAAGATVEMSNPNTLSGTLILNGRNLTGESSFNPGATTSVVYSGAITAGNPTGLPTSDASSAITNMMTNLKNVYTSSTLASYGPIQQLITTPTGSLGQFGTSIVTGQLGGNTSAGTTSTTVTYTAGCDTPDITLPNGQVWAACNVGATKAFAAGTTITNCGGSATDCVSSLRDTLGGYYQWGRNDNVAPQGTPTATLASAGTTASSVGHSNFIQNPNAPYDWISTQNDNLWGGAGTNTSAGTFTGQTAPNQTLMQGPCPSGYHVPTIREWCNAAASIDPAITCTASWQNNTSIASTLKLPLAGYRGSSTSAYTFQSTYGFYWAASPSTAYGHILNVSASQVFPANYNNRANGFSVRCLKN